MGGAARGWAHSAGAYAGTLPACDLGWMAKFSPGFLGIGHQRLTVKFQGLDARLTGISGDVVHDILV